MDDNNFDYYKALFFLLCCKLEINETRKQQEICSPSSHKSILNILHYGTINLCLNMKALTTHAVELRNFSIPHNKQQMKTELT